MLVRGRNVLPIATPSYAQAMANPESARRPPGDAQWPLRSPVDVVRSGPFVVLAQRVDRRGRHLLEWRIGVHGLERLPDLLAQMPRDDPASAAAFVRTVRYFANDASSPPDGLTSRNVTR